MRKDVDKFVVGYVGRDYHIYGRDSHPGGETDCIEYFTSLKKAEREKQTFGVPTRVAIYKLVAVKMPAKRRKGRG